MQTPDFQDHNSGSRIQSQLGVKETHTFEVAVKLGDKKLPTPVNVLVLAQFLQDYDGQEKDFILSGFSNGFSVCSENLT